MNETQTDIAILKEQVSEIRTNHLPHIQAKIDNIEFKLDREQWLVITTLLGVVITLGILLLK